jgi:predicted enzyme related to lactoylglutathione lyase
MSYFAPVTLIVVNNPQSTSNFFQSLFNCPFTSHASPCSHHIQKISNMASLILIDSSLCDEDILEKFAVTAVRSIYIYVENCNEMMLRAIGCGGQVIESKIDVEHDYGTCTIEGPEGILIYVSSAPRNGFTQQSPTEWLMSKVALTNEDQDRPEPAKIPSQRMSFHPRPIIHTLDVSLLSKNGFIPCPPNSRKPTPFETDVSSSFGSTHTLCLCDSPPFLDLQRPSSSRCQN